MPKIAFITGASRGIGAATAHRLAGEGYHLALLARSEAALEALAAELRATHGLSAEAIAVIVADLSSSEGCHAAFHAALAHFGRLDVLINNAGEAAPVGLMQELSDAGVAHMLALNLQAPMLLTKYALQQWLQQGEAGSVVCINSIAGKTAFPYWAVYDATKHGLAAFCKAVQEEQRSNGTRLISIYPGATHTTIWDAVDLAQADAAPDWAGMLQPSQVADAIAYALAQPAGTLISDITLEPTRPVL